ncbi:MAG: hypothetical protein JWM33_3675 [Caulobacteraceae bacterium]|nr:hypothetical protein [Caulobacteraceae bacterium]
MTARLTPEMIAVSKRARMLGYYTHIIAAYYRINQGRISEINTGKRGEGIAPAAALPADFPALVN